MLIEIQIGRQAYRGTCDVDEVIVKQLVSSTIETILYEYICK